MLNQLAVTLAWPYICSPGNRVSSFVTLIKRAVRESDWSAIPSDVLVGDLLLEMGMNLTSIIWTLFDSDCELQYYIGIMNALPVLDGVLFCTLIENHYILLEHIICTGQVIGHNSMSPLPPGVNN